MKIFCLRPHARTPLKLWFLIQAPQKALLIYNNMRFRFRPKWTLISSAILNFLDQKLFTCAMINAIYRRYETKRWLVCVLQGIVTSIGIKRHWVEQVKRIHRAMIFAVALLPEAVLVFYMKCRW